MTTLASDAAHLAPISVSRPHEIVSGRKGEIEKPGITLMTARQRAASVVNPWPKKTTMGIPRIAEAVTGFDTLPPPPPPERFSAQQQLLPPCTTRDRLQKIREPAGVVGQR
jgi:hypothetical protein